MTKFVLTAGFLLFLYLLIVLKLVSYVFLEIFNPSRSPVGLEGFIVIWFWLAGIVFWLVTGLISLTIAAKRFSKFVFDRYSTTKLMIVSGFSFFGFFGASIVLLILYSLLKTL